MQSPMTETSLRHYLALTDGAGFADVSDRAQVRVTGADRAKFLNGFCTNDIQRLSAGAGCEAFLANARGRLVGHAFVFCGAEDLTLESSPGQAELLIRHLDRYVIREDVQLQDLHGRVAELLVAGQRSPEMLAGLTGRPAPAEMLSHCEAVFGLNPRNSVLRSRALRCEQDSAREGQATGGPARESQATAGRSPCPNGSSGIPIALRRVPLAVAPAFLLSFPTAHLAEVQQALIADGLEFCGAEAFETVRVEAGFPLYGRDVTEEHLPQEVNRDAQAISLRKGCYLGQETVARIDALGHVNRKLVQLRWHGPEIPQPGMDLTVAGQSIGRVTSAVWSPRCGGPLTLACLRRGFDRPGTRIETECGIAEVVQSRDLDTFRKK